MSIGGIRIKENIGPAAPAAHGVIVFRGLALCLSQPSPPPPRRPSARAKGAGRRMQTRRAHSTLSAGEREVSRAAIYHRQCWLQTCGLVFCYFSRPPTKKLCAATNWPDSRTRACPSRRIHRRNNSLLPNEEYWHVKRKNPLVLVN